MSEEMIIRHCSPTLAGLKTANMFNCEYESEEELTQYLRNINTRLSRKGVRAIPLSCADNRALIYLFRPDDLEKDLSDERAVKILASAGQKEGLLLQRRLQRRKQLPDASGRAPERDKNRNGVPS